MIMEMMNHWGPVADLIVDLRLLNTDLFLLTFLILFSFSLFTFSQRSHKQNLHGWQPLLLILFAKSLKFFQVYFQGPTENPSVTTCVLMQIGIFIPSNNTQTIDIMAEVASSDCPSYSHSCVRKKWTYFIFHGARIWFMKNLYFVTTYDF